MDSEQKRKSPFRRRLPGALVLDPFGGSGTTAVAALRLGRRFIHIDPSALSAVTLLHRLRPWLGTDGFRVSVVSWTREGERELARWGLSQGPITFYASERSDSQTASLLSRLPWDDGRNWILLGDCLKWLSVIPEGTVDLIYADPPFANEVDRQEGWTYDVTDLQKIDVEHKSTRAVFEKLGDIKANIQSWKLAGYIGGHGL